MGASGPVRRRGDDAIFEGRIILWATLLLLLNINGAGVVPPARVRVDLSFVLFASWPRDEARLLRTAIKGHVLDEHFPAVKAALTDARWLAGALGMQLDLLVWRTALSVRQR